MSQQTPKRISSESFKNINKTAKDLFFLLFICNLKISSVSFTIVKLCTFTNYCPPTYQLTN